jgi:hypothetical protein
MKGISKMKKSIKTAIVGLLLVPALALGSMLIPMTASAADCTGTDIESGAACAKGTGQATNLFGTGGIFQTITNTALFIIGAISVLMLIYGGIRYTISGGDAKNVEAAKSTIMYAIIGIVVALLAFAIVNFVLTSLVATPATT